MNLSFDRKKFAREDFFAVLISIKICFPFQSKDNKLIVYIEIIDSPQILKHYRNRAMYVDVCTRFNKYNNQ